MHSIWNEQIFSPKKESSKYNFNATAIFLFYKKKKKKLLHHKIVLLLSHNKFTLIKIQPKL